MHATWKSNRSQRTVSKLIVLLTVVSTSLFCPIPSTAQQAESRSQNILLNDGLLGHWPLAGNVQDISGNQRHATIHGNLNFDADGPTGSVGGVAVFNGRDAWLEVSSPDISSLGTKDFSIAVWMHTEQSLDDVPGDLVTQFDSKQRRGFQLSLKTNAVTTSLANHGHLTFGIDSNQTSEWMDCGRPGNALLAFGMAVHDGSLYAGTCEPGKDESGRVYRYHPSRNGAAGQWVDCGAPDGSNSVTALAVHNGSLYAGTGRYRVAGSALPESENQEPGGRIFRFEQPDQWILCGQLPETEAVGGMIVYRDQLYASSLYKPAGFFRYDGRDTWTNCGTPDGKRVVALGIYNGHLYATSYDGGLVFRFDGQTWTSCGQLADNTQTYSFAVYQGRLFVGTWPSGRVYRFEDIDEWTDMGRLGEELEVMGMLVHNGGLIAGTLPLAEVYSYQDDKSWQKQARLDHTPDVKYRRAWTMAEHAGRLYCSTLPSGKIFSMAAGKSVSTDDSIPSGWHHVIATKSADRLQLFIDGRKVAESSEFPAGDFDLQTTESLKIGFGQNDYFLGRLSDVRIYQRCLNDAEISSLAAGK